MKMVKLHVVAKVTVYVVNGAMVTRGSFRRGVGGYSPHLNQIFPPLELSTISLSIPVSTTSVEKSFSQNLLMKPKKHEHTSTTKNHDTIINTTYMYYHCATS